MILQVTQMTKKTLKTTVTMMKLLLAALPHVQQETALAHVLIVLQKVDNWICALLVSSFTVLYRSIMCHAVL